jgi:hypothetical protein
MAERVVKQDEGGSTRQTFYLIVLVSFLGRLPGELELVVNAWKTPGGTYKLAFQSLQLLVQFCVYLWALLFTPSSPEKTYRVALASGVSVLMRIYADTVEDCVRWYVGGSPFTVNMGVFVITCLWISTISYWLYKKIV